VALERLTQLRELVSTEVILEVDGGVNRDTIGRCTAAGAELLVVGSAIFRQDDYASAVQLLRQQARYAG
jgi:ribulose-phosphate 3-epimerase